MRFLKQKQMQRFYLENVAKIEEKFLWLPLTIDYETRWFEKARIEYRVKKEQNIFTFNYYYYWDAYEFLD